jgi:hypothetical protein
MFVGQAIAFQVRPQPINLYNQIPHRNRPIADFSQKNTNLAIGVRFIDGADDENRTHVVSLEG